MSDDHDTQFYCQHDHTHRSNSSVSTATSENEANKQPTIHQPVPTRPRLPSRKGSVPIVNPSDSPAVGPHLSPDDTRAMSPRCTSEDIDRLGNEAREEIQGLAKALRESLITIINRVEEVCEENNMLDSSNKCLQKYITELSSNCFPSYTLSPVPNS